MLQLNNISKTFHPSAGTEIEAIRHINATIKPGEFIAIVGPSGCGKTTLLRIIAGLTEPSSGSILLNNEIITGPGKDRGMVFQNFSLFPWLTVRENIAFGLHLQNMAGIIMA